MYAPIMAVAGLAQAATWPASAGTSNAVAAVTAFAIHAALMLRCDGRRHLLMLTTAQALLLAIAVTYYVRWSELPTGA